MLGSGLDTLLSQAFDISTSEQEDKFIQIELKEITTNPYQPRKVFDKNSIQELADSLKEHGQIQPIVLANYLDKFVIVAGERRYRAAKLAKFKTIKAMVVNIPKDKLREISIIENIQREDLNPVELANSYKQLIKQFNITHEELAKKVKKSRASITNTLRVLSLSPFVIEQLLNNKITLGHAKTLFTLDEKEQNRLTKNIIKNNISVKEQEEISKKVKLNIKKEPNSKFIIDKTVSSKIISYFQKKDIKVKVVNNKIVFDIKNRENIDNFVNIFLN